MEDKNPAPMEPEDNGISLDDAIAMMPEDAPNESDPNTTAKPADDGTKTDDAEEKHPEDAEDDKTEVAAEDEAAQEIKDEVFVQFEDGTKASIGELKQAYQEVAEVRANTTRELQGVAEERGNLQSLGANMYQALENVSNYLVSRLPPEPDQRLLYENPALFQQMEVHRRNAELELQDMLQVVQGTRQAHTMLSEDQFNAMKSAEDQKLIAALPNLKDPKRFSAAHKAGRDYWLSIGGTAEEYDSTVEHRLRRMAIDAAYGRKSRAELAKAKGKVENASPMLPVKSRQHPNSKEALERVNAMKRLAKSGSIDDAVKAYTG